MIIRLWVVLSLLVLVSSTISTAQAEERPADSTVSEDSYEEDPFEPVNRAVFQFNEAFDNTLLEPAARIYRKVVPMRVRGSIRSFLFNLTEPVTFVNAVLQRDVDRSFTAFWRFVVNSTWGVAGLFDIAEIAGLDYRKEDFGQTMGVYQVKPGPYLVLPVLGPSDTRDAFGLAVDVFTDPFNYIFNEYNVAARTTARFVDTREDLLEVTDEIDRVSLDPYASIRSLYLQKRQSDIEDHQ